MARAARRGNAEANGVVGGGIHAGAAELCQRGHARTSRQQLQLRRVRFANIERRAPACWRWMVWLGLGLLAGCSASYPDGKIACSSNAECPSGFTCRTRNPAGSSLFCFTGPAPEQTDSGPRGSEDGAAIGGNSSTGESKVGAREDAGPRMTDSVAGADAAGGAGGAGSAGANEGGRGGANAAGDGSMGARDGGPAADGSTETGDAEAVTGCDEALFECEPGTTETQQLPCGLCNTGTQRAARSCGTDCRWGTPEPSGECTDVTAACEPGEEMAESRGCECGRTQARTLTCSDSCTWVGGEWGACDLTGVECQPGMTQTQTVACASCGTRTQQRSCAADSCSWGDWSDVSSACASSCEDCTEVQFCMAPSDQPNPGGTKCRQTDRACTREQALADCQEDIPVVCGRVSEPFLMQYL